MVFSFFFFAFLFPSQLSKNRILANEHTCVTYWHTLLPIKKKKRRPKAVVSRFKIGSSFCLSSIILMLNHCVSASLKQTLKKEKKKTQKSARDESSDVGFLLFLRSCAYEMRALHSEALMTPFDVLNGLPCQHTTPSALLHTSCITSSKFFASFFFSTGS